MLRKLLISLASEHIYFSCFHQLLVFMHTWDGLRSWSLWTPVSSGVGGWILEWGGEGTRKLVSDFLPPKVTEVWSASPGLRRVRVEKHVPCVMESLPLSQLLPSTSYCPTLTPPLSDLDQGLFMAVLMLDHPTITLSSLPTSPPCLHLLHCTRLYLTSPRTFSPFLLPTLSPDATHQALCSVGTSLVPVCHVWGAQHGTLGLEVLGTPAGCQLCFSTSSSGSPDCGDVGGLKGCDTGRRAIRSQQMVTKPCMWEKAWSEGSAIWWGPGWMDIKEAVTGIGQNYQYPFKCAGTEWDF